MQREESVGRSDTLCTAEREANTPFSVTSSPVIALSYAAGIATHLWFNSSYF